MLKTSKQKLQRSKHVTKKKSVAFVDDQNASENMPKTAKNMPKTAKKQPETTKPSARVAVDLLSDIKESPPKTLKVKRLFFRGDKKSATPARGGKKPERSQSWFRLEAWRTKCKKRSSASINKSVGFVLTIFIYFFNTINLSRSIKITDNLEICRFYFSISINKSVGFFFFQILK